LSIDSAYLLNLSRMQRPYCCTATMEQRCSVSGFTGTSLAAYNRVQPYVTASQPWAYNLGIFLLFICRSCTRVSPPLSFPLSSLVFLFIGNPYVWSPLLSSVCRAVTQPRVVAIWTKTQNFCLASLMKKIDNTTIQPCALRQVHNSPVDAG